MNNQWYVLNHSSSSKAEHNRKAIEKKTPKAKPVPLLCPGLRRSISNVSCRVDHGVDRYQLLVEQPDLGQTIQIIRFRRACCLKNCSLWFSEDFTGFHGGERMLDVSA